MYDFLFHFSPRTTNYYLVMVQIVQELRRKSVENMQMVTNDRLKKFFGVDPLLNADDSARTKQKDVTIHSEEVSLKIIQI